MEQTSSHAIHFFRNLGTSEFLIVRSDESRWRTRVKLAVRRQKGNTLAIGLFRRGSHHVTPIPCCVSHHPSINKAIALLSSLPPSLGYHESTRTGELRYIQAVVERETERVQLSLVLNSPSLATNEVRKWEHSGEELYASSPDFWHSVWLNLQPLPTNTIFGPIWKHVVGLPMIFETIGGCKIPFLPFHFAQANLDMFERLLSDLVVLLPREARVIELFAGMGVISLVIRRHVASAIAVERDAGAYKAFVQAKQWLPKPLQQGLDFVVADASCCQKLLTEASTLIVDPPRKGLEKDLVASVARAQNIRTMFYVSCHFPTLERDINALISQGGFRISFARSYVFFPGTDQLETLVQFER